MALSVDNLQTHKDLIRQRVWPALRQVAIPDSRFHLDFSSFIANFQGSSLATQRLISHPAFVSAKTIFITPDNCLRELRYAALSAGKLVLVTTYAIRRGFILLDPVTIPTESQRLQASYLDGMEESTSGARPIPLADMLQIKLKIDLMVTGTGAINMAGVRFGKGHGFFDLEWGMLFRLGIVELGTACVALVHDCQVLDEKLEPEEFDTVCDVIITPTRLIEVDNDKRMAKPNCGILWEKLQPNMLDDIPPLKELREIESNV